jgi:hypothetical protein
LVPAWADSVLLCWGSAVAYDDSGLDDDLIVELQAWDLAYHDSVRGDGRWRSEHAQDAFEAEGIRLAHRVATALGAGFAVEFNDKTVRSQRGPENPTAAAAFEVDVDREEAALRRVTDQLARGEPCSDPRPPAASVEEPGAWLREVGSRTSRPVRVSLSPDLSVGFPVEVVVDGRPGYVDPEMLGISESLSRDLEEFQDWWERHRTDDEGGSDPSEEAEWAQWRQQGNQLVKRLQMELGDDYYVAWI